MVLTGSHGSALHFDFRSLVGIAQPSSPSPSAMQVRRPIDRIRRNVFRLKTVIGFSAAKIHFERRVTTGARVLNGRFDRSADIGARRSESPLPALIDRNKPCSYRPLTYRNVFQESSPPISQPHAFFPMLSPRISAAHFIFLDMRQRPFNCIGVP